MYINWWTFTLAIIPFLFVAWVKANPLDAIELVRTLRRRWMLAQARKIVARKVNTEYRSHRMKAIQNGAPTHLIDEMQNKHRDKLINKLTEKLYWRWMAESGDPVA